MPGYDNYQKMSKELVGAVKSGAVLVTWKDQGKAFEYMRDGKLHRFDVGTGMVTQVTEPKEIPKGPPKGPGPGARIPPGGAARGRQSSTAGSPDGQFKAFYRDRNLWLSDAKGLIEMAVTTDGSEKSRIKNGSASWVYGEELFQRSAMWWAPDSKKIAFYRFDETAVADYYLALDQTALMTKLDAEPYPKAGAPNPVVDLLVYDLASKKTVKIDVRDGKPFGDDTVGHYAYRVSWTADGSELLFERTNRRQNVLELVAADPVTGKCRVIVREEWPASWVENLPGMLFLKDGRRFIWTSERTGWRNFYLYDLSGKQLATLTGHPFEVANVLRVDEAAGHVYYTARSGDNPMKLQLHRVGLDGTGDTRLTDPAYHHTIDLAPDARHFVDVYQTHASPPASRLVSADGKTVADLGKADTSTFDKLGFRAPELLTFKAADGTTDLYGLLSFPSNFDPAKKYPLLVSVYAGPGTNGARETFSPPSALTEYGFLVASFDSRSAGGRGKKFLDAIYGKLGVVEIDDQAAGVKSLWERPYLDRTRVGIYGGSYGGYASIMCLLRHSDVFQAACASSPVTDYRLYDSIYTERYMGLPQDNKAGYDAGSAVVHAAKLKGRLMIYYGTADNNVHPSNSLQLIRALQRAGKSFDVQVGPDQGHSGISQPRMMEYFIENLVLRK
ncbi:S9 family peptidase [Frigoriglobus tundricola]|uniref:Dipeptidyl peptidase IV n=1 Tax=Frigoriglobus tundricola TaxID=2774151 RepID=A0A6M5Z546_9BACT|nr:DPP IV N-terminal domain-containing protein [Frigoriglobus tundricola]QJX00574.1 Dipeptidyl peptidase IV [Frigoriglobus tundricola]